ncbi:aspartyl/asparaginyl beta-hydroxylase domain-containing protein [Kitasatospora sp. NPDC006697]|uniref:aspartyl/asparaginyl beta-hydroxylase domain-containing protein n=1 Tax=Kitasatospora sp. NPDC006697 TaxID=3364020 RepID=UPI0036BE988C
MRTQLIGKIELDQERLAKDLERALGLKLSEPYEEFVCGEPWKCAMVFAPGGEIHDVIADYDPATPAAFTEQGDALPYVQEIIRNNFATENLTFVRLAVFSNSVLVPHRDYVEISDPVSKQRIAHRLHIVLATGENCLFNETDTVYRMKEGETWFIDVTRSHSAGVLDTTKRIHLMIDFAEVSDVDEVLRFPYSLENGIPEANLCDRPALADEERAGILALASVIDQENMMDVLGLIIKKHYRRDGGPNFVWSTMQEIARLSEDEAIIKQVADLFGHTNLERIEYSPAG